jgi:hypothetical protein
MTAIRQYPNVAGTSTTEGLVSYVIDGSWAPFRSWNAVTNGHAVRYVATDGVQYEEGYGVKSTGPTLTRDEILSTTADNQSKIDWGTGTRVVYIVPDLDTTFEAELGQPFVHFLKAPQIESGDRRFRWWTSDGVMRISDATSAPFVNMVIYNSLDATPKWVTQVPANFTAGLEINGTAVTSVATSGFADELTAQAGASTAAVMHPLAVAQALAAGPLVIGNRSYREAVAYTDEMLVRWSGGLARTNLADVDELFTLPNYDSGERPLNAGPVIVSHGLGKKPDRVRWEITCTATDAGHAAGHTIDSLAFQTQADVDNGLTVVKTASQLKFLFSGLRVMRPDNTGPPLIDLSKWTVRLKAWIGGATP